MKKKKKYRSKFEGRVANSCKEMAYEPIKIKYVQEHTYCPDWRLPNGIFVETKGLFTSAMRTKTLLVRKQHPDLDLRFLFQKASNKLSKRSKTSYADWCDRNGIIWAEGDKVPQAWIDEPAKSLKAETMSSK